ncbi:hypothetical protein E2562_007457 [Oryza meyeriana var. granulata]|uniref:Uncharacterized protein n=1 Tax=Oryza meyeriana var. granulata TaxID=110450 RepID=A0A6G1F4W6_9ORYZ|nr:hypothetical protein E2562_007457 [Oryza meyeriana var. granulata]
MGHNSRSIRALFAIPAKEDSYTARKFEKGQIDKKSMVDTTDPLVVKEQFQVGFFSKCENVIQISWY